MYFLDLFPYKKLQKRVYYSRGTPEAEVARHAHMAEPHKAKWTRGRIRGCMDLVGWRLMAPRV